MNHKYKQFYQIIRIKKMDRAIESQIVNEREKNKLELLKQEPPKHICMGRGFIGMSNYPLQSKPCSRTATHLVYFFDDDIVGLDDNQHLTLDDVRQLYKNRYKQCNSQKYDNCQCECDQKHPCQRCIKTYYDRPIYMCNACMGLTEFDYVELLNQSVNQSDELGQFCCGLGYVKFRGSCSGPNKQCQKCKMHGGYVCCGEPISVLHYLTCNEKPVHNIGNGYVLCDDCYCLFTTEHLINSTFEQKIKHLLGKK